MQLNQSGEGIIRPVKGKHDPPIGPVALMVMLPEALERLAQEAGAPQTPFSDASLYRLYLAGQPNGTVALAGPFFGAPHAVMGLEKLIALGARNLWVLGWCGAIQRDLHVGDLIVPTKAVAEEGTSRHYPLHGKTPSADPELSRTLMDAMGIAGLMFRSGTVWTTDAIYRETPNKITHFQKLGVLAVDMEMSALMTVAAYRSAALSALLVVSDELSHLTWRPGFSSPLLKERTRTAGELLLKLARTFKSRDPQDPSGPPTGRES